MKICIDARSQSGAGVNTYISYLLENIFKMDNENEYVLVHHLTQQFKQHPNVRNKICPFKNPILQLLWSQTILPPFLKKEGIEIYHGLKHFGAFYSSVKTVYTLHEVGQYIIPETFNWHDRIYWTKIQNIGLKKYNKIISTTKFIKDYVVDNLGIQENKIVMIPLGLDKQFRVIKEKNLLDTIKVKYHLPDKFLLCVGSIIPKKNFETVVRAYARLYNKKPDYKIVIVGTKGYKSSDLFSLIKMLNLEEEIIFTDFIGHDDLPLIYNCADIFLYPSLYEGFGMPSLEAMACGTPVITANRGALPEVTEGAALLLNNPSDEMEMCEAILHLLDDHELQKDLIKRGLERAQYFSWKKCARDTLHVYQELADS